MRNEYQIGDRVKWSWDDQSGIGTIVGIDPEPSLLPFRVKGDNEVQCGGWNISYNGLEFHFEQEEEILVSDEGIKWIPRYFLCAVPGDVNQKYQVKGDLIPNHNIGFKYAKPIREKKQAFTLEVQLNGEKFNGKVNAETFVRLVHDLGQYYETDES